MAKKHRLRGVTEDDVIEAGASTESKVCRTYKTKQYISVCKIVVDRLLTEVGARGTSPSAIRDSVNAVDRACGEYKTEQYKSVCVRAVGSYVREIAVRKPGLAGLLKGRRR